MRCPTCGRSDAFDVLGWLDAKGVRLRPAPAYSLRYLFEHAHEITSADEWCEAMQVRANTLRVQMAKKALPAPRVWLAAARGLYLADEIRMDPHRGLAQVAFAVGYADHSAIVHALRRTFGSSANHLRKGSVTDTVLMERWWRKHAPTGTQERKAA